MVVNGFKKTEISMQSTVDLDFPGPLGECRHPLAHRVMMGHVCPLMLYSISITAGTFRGTLCFCGEAVHT